MGEIDREKKTQQIRDICFHGEKSYSHRNEYIHRIRNPN